MITDSFSFKKYLFLLFSLIFILPSAQKKFTIVLDAGHGGSDHGANRYYSEVGTLREKDVTLAIVLKIGRMLEKNKDFKETYNKYLKSIHLKEVNSQLYADFKSKELETKPGNIDGFCLVSDKEKIKQNLDDNKYVLSKIRSMRIEYTKCGAENKLKI